ncbi:MAG: glycosyltransferase family 4 protein [Bacteroidia bacterium]|nr:glycosyltransferase family 4 protein [Bacteroidia bacterium]
MNVLFLMIAYPDVSGNSSMYTDLTLEFASKGYNVFVAVANGSDKTSLNIEGGLKVLRVKTLELFNTSFIKKGLANILLPYQVTKGIEKYLRGVHFDAVIVSTPPITYLSTVARLKKKFRSKVYLILRDIFPQNAKDLGIINSSILFKYFRGKEKKLYSISDFIGCMSPGNIAYLIEHDPGIAKSKFHLLPNWKTVMEYRQPDLNLKRQFGLENKFIALYGGNFGKPQQIDDILDFAKEMIHFKDVVFLFVGDGYEKRRIIELVAKKELFNVLIINSLPRDQYQELVKICDIGLVNLSDKFTIPNIPSRTLSYWEAKIPILAAIDKNTDFCTILEQSGSGLWSITGDLNSYKQNFEKLYFNKELRISMGEKGYKYLKENCTTENAFSIIHEKLNS